MEPYSVDPLPAERGLGGVIGGTPPEEIFILCSGDDAEYLSHVVSAVEENLVLPYGFHVRGVDFHFAGVRAFLEYDTPPFFLVRVSELARIAKNLGDDGLVALESGGDRNCPADTSTCGEHRCERVGDR